MSIISFILLLAIAALAGMLGQALVGYSVGGCLISAVVGFVGAFLGMWISRTIGLPEPLMVSVGGESFPVLWSVIGSALFTAVLAMINRRRLV